MMSRFKKNEVKQPSGREVDTDALTPSEINEEAVQTINSIGDVMRVLYELEGAAEKMVDVYLGGSKFDGEDDLEVWRRIRQIVGETEFQTRSIRAYLSKLKATTIVRNTNAQPDQREIEKLGFCGFVSADSIEICVPYFWIASTSSFIFTIKRLRHFKNLTDATSEWHWMMEGVLKKLEPHVPFDLPIKHAEIDIVFFKPNLPLGDPDHFWYRPVIDAFVQRRFIMNDDASTLQIHVTYEHDSDHPELRIKLKKLPDDYKINVRQNDSQKVF